MKAKLLAEQKGRKEKALDKPLDHTWTNFLTTFFLSLIDSLC
jgi:hypothetical protein